MLTGIRRVLCLGAHSDDIEIGCGGTLLRLAAQTPDLAVRWAVLSASPDRADEATRSARDLLGRSIAPDIRMGAFPDGDFPAHWSEIRAWMLELRHGMEPDVVFTHFRDDRHQDHRTVSDLTWSTFRSHLILEYEVPKWDGDLGRPNVYVPLPEDVAERKVDLLMKHFDTQRCRHWFSEDLFLGMMRVRGIECGARYAESFHARKLIARV